ncbi:hypothetical protein [Tateyamaria sp.]|uniref:hypothetical protein n=1 Tax=Tateyamaria sp. TaxID=1929288 RepID=UPI00329E638B
MVGFATSGLASCEGRASYVSWAQPVAFADDGSFENAGRGRWGYAFGGRVVDVGNGRVAQRITIGPRFCTQLQSLFFMDCTRNESIVFEGRLRDPDVGIAGPPLSFIRDIQPPHGPIALTRSSTVESLSDIATENDIEFVTDAKDFFEENRLMKRIDLRRACRIFYPDTAGAAG